MIKKTLIAVGLAVSMAFAVPATAMESTLAKVKQSGTIKLGYRENSIPFSFVADGNKAPGCQMLKQSSARMFILFRRIGIINSPSVNRTC